MHLKLLQGEDDSSTVLVYPATMDEYGQALDTLGGPACAAGTGSPDAGRGGGHTVQGYVVTTAAQRERWGLADLAASGRVRVVDEAQALGLLCDGAAGLGAVEAPLSGAAAEVPPPAGGRSVASALESVRALAAPGARLEQVLEALEAAELPRPASETLRRSVRALGSDAAAVDEALDRAEMVLALPWRMREPERFDPAYVAQALDRTHGGLERVKTRLLQVLAACPQTRGPLTVEGVRRNRGAETDRPPRAGRTPGTSPDAHARSLPRRAFGNGQDVAGGGRRRGARPHPRARAAGQGECRVPDPRGRERRHRAHRPRVCTKPG